MSWQALLPIGRNEIALLGELVDVTGERQRDDVGLEAVDDRARLFAGAAVRLLDRDVFAGLLFPVLDERGVELLIELARRVIGNVQQRRLGQRNVRAADEPCCDGECQRLPPGEIDLHRCILSVRDLNQCGPGKRELATGVFLPN